MSMLPPETDPALAAAPLPAPVDPIATIDPGAATAPTTIDDTVGPDGDPERSLASIFDEAEDRLDEAERTVADLLVGHMIDVPIERDEIKLSISGDSTRPGGAPMGGASTPNENAPVVAAVDMTRQGGFDEAGVWHDVRGRFAKKGWSGLKHAALAFVAGAAARDMVDSDGPQRLRIKDRRLASRFDLGDDGRVLARYGDSDNAIIENRDGRPVRVPWSSFDEPARATVNEMAPRWEDDGPDTVVPAVGDTVFVLRDQGSVFTGEVTSVGDGVKVGGKDIRGWKTYATADDARDAASRSVFAYLAGLPTPPAPGGGWHDYHVEARQKPRDEVDYLTPAGPSSNPGPIRARTPEEAVAKADTSGGWPTGRVREVGQRGEPVTVPVIIRGAVVDPETGERIHPPGDAPTLDQIRGRDPKRTLEFVPPAKEDIKFGRKQYGGTVEWETRSTARDKFAMGALYPTADGQWQSGGAEPGKTRFDAVVNDMRQTWDRRNPDPQAAYDAEQAEILAERQGRLLEQTVRWEQARDDHAAALERLGLPAPTVNEMARGIIERDNLDPTRNTGANTGGPTVNELTTRPTGPAPARLDRRYTGDSIRSQALDMNGGLYSPEAERIVSGRPIVDVAWTEDGTVLRTPGVLDPDGGFLPAGGPERTLRPQGLDLDAETFAEGWARTVAGYGVDARVRRAGEADGRMVWLTSPTAPTMNELVERPPVLPPLDEDGHFATLDRVTEDALVWRVSHGPGGETIHRTSIVGQYQGDGPSAPLNAINVKIVEVPQSVAGLGARVSWSVDAANPIVTRQGQWDARYNPAAGAVDPYSWNDPLEAPSWTAEGTASGMFFDGTLLEQAKAEAVWALNDMAASKTFRPLNMDHTVDGPAAAARAVDTDPNQPGLPFGTMAGQEDPFPSSDYFDPNAPTVNELAVKLTSKVDKLAPDFTPELADAAARFLTTQGGMRQSPNDRYLPDNTQRFTQGYSTREWVDPQMTTANPDPDAMALIQAWRKALVDHVAEKGGDGAVLHRGVVDRGTDPFVPQRTEHWSNEYNDVRSQPNSAESRVTSWTSVKATAKQFGGHLVTQDIPVDQILGRFGSINGEVLVVDDPLIGRAVDAWPNDVDGIPSAPFNTFPDRYRAVNGGTPTVAAPADAPVTLDEPDVAAPEAPAVPVPVPEPVAPEPARQTGADLLLGYLAKAQADKQVDEPITVLNPPTPARTTVEPPPLNKLAKLPRWETEKSLPDDRGRSTPYTDAEKALGTVWTFNAGSSSTDPMLVKVRHSGGDAAVPNPATSGRRPSDPELALNPTVLSVYAQYGDNTARGAYNPAKFGHVAQVTLNGPDAMLYSGDLAIPVPGEGDRNPDEVARWAAQVIGDPVAAVGRANASAAATPLGVFGAMAAAPTPHGVVLIRGSMFQPFLDATSIRDALDRADNSVVGRGMNRSVQEKYTGRNRFARSLGAVSPTGAGGAGATGPVNTKVLVLDEKSAARWRSAYDGVLADADRFKDERKQWQAARKAAKRAQQQVLPTTNDLVDMPPAERAKAQGTAYLVTKDGYLSRLGVEKGQALAVRYVDDTTGQIDVLDGQQVRTQDVKWDRFADTAPAAAPKVDVPEVTGNDAVRNKAEAAQATASRVQAAGTTGAPVEVADSYLGRYGAPKGSIVTVSYLDDRNAVLNVDGRQVKAGWARFTQRVPRPDNQGGWTLEEPAAEPTINELIDRPADDSFRTTVLRQIGSMNVMAISGGRVEMIHDNVTYSDGTNADEPIGVRLPVAAGYRVDVVLDRASDTYTVNRVFVRGGKEYPKGTMSGVYAEQVGDIAYAASIYLEPFGTPSAGSDDAQMSLLDLAPTEVRVIAQGTPDFTGAGWYPTDAVGGFRSPDGGITVRRDRTPAGEMHWHARDTRGDGIYVRGDSYVGTTPDAVMAWAKERDAVLSTTPVDTTKTVTDARLAELAADPDVTIAGSRSLPSATKPYGLVASTGDGRVSEVLGQYKTPQEARGAEQDLRRRTASLPADVVDQAARKRPTLAVAADVKASAVKPGDWVTAIQGETIADGGYRLDGVGPNPDGTINLIGPSEGQMHKVPAIASVSILRPTKLPELGDDPKFTASIERAHLEAMAPAQLDAVRRVVTDQASATPLGSPANAQAVNTATAIDRIVEQRNEMAARPMRDFNVEMTTATGGRFVDTVKARTPHEAIQRANRANGHYTGGRWYAVTAAPANAPTTNEMVPAPDTPEYRDAAARYGEAQARRDRIRRQAMADGTDPNFAPGSKEAEREMGQARTAMYALRGLDADGVPTINEMALPDYLGRAAATVDTAGETPLFTSADGKNVIETSVRLGSGDLPPQPGTAAIPEGATRLYHWPSSDPDLADSLANGLVDGTEQRPLWAQTYPPVADVVPYIEFWAPPSTIGLDIGHGHVAIVAQVPPGNIVSYNTPMVDALRRLRSLDWGYDRLAGLRDRYPAGSPERQALEARLAEIGAPTTNEFRPFDMIRRARQVPSAATLAALAASGVPNGDGRILTAAEVQAMTPSELVALDKAMSRWLAMHPYGDIGGTDLLDMTRLAPDAAPEPVEPAAPRRAARPGNGGTLGYIPMSPLDAPGDYEPIAAGLDVDVVDLDMWDPEDDIVDIPMPGAVT